MGVLSGSFNNKNSGGGVISQLKKQGLIDTSDTEREIALRNKQKQQIAQKDYSQLTPFEGMKILSPEQALSTNFKPINTFKSDITPLQRDIAEKYIAGVGGFADSATLGLFPTLQKFDKLQGDNYQRTKQIEEKQPIATTVGNLAGYLIPGAGMTKVLGGTSLGKALLPKAGDTLLKSIGKGALTGALENSAMGGIEGGFESVRDNKPLIPSIAKRAEEGLLSGTILGGLGSALGKGLNVLKTNRELKLNNINDTQAAESILKPVNVESNINSLPKQEVPFKTQINANNVPDINVGKSKPINFDTIKTFDDLPKDEVGLQQFISEAENLIKSGKDKELKMNLQLFAEEAQRRLKQRKFASNSIMNAEVIPEEMKQTISNNMPTYEPLTNKKTWNDAVDKVNSNIKTSMDEWKALDSVKTADDTALGQALMVDAIKKGDVSTANEIAYELSEKLTKAGQSVQAASILKRLSPEGILTYANRTLKRAEKELGDKFKNKLKLTDEEAKQITDRMNKMNEMPEGREKDIEFANIQKIISDKIPPNMRDKLKALQRVNLLFNPKTMIRNISGNIIFSTLNNIKDTARAGIDKGISSLFKTERSALLPNLKTQVKGMVIGVKNTLQDYKLGIDTSNMPTQYELNTKASSPFKSKLFKKADELTNLGLKLGDSPFYKAAYDDALRQQIKIKGVTEATPEIKAFAENVAKERTFQDTNKFTEFFDGIRNGLNKIGIKGFGLGDVVLPFTKTPANILKAGVEYSPLNIVNVANNAIKFAKGKNSVDQYKLVDSLAKTLTGTGLLGAGIYLAQKGIITGKSPEDYDASTFQKEQGILPYALNLGNKFVSFDWAQPASIPLAMGADIYNNFKNSKDAKQAIWEGAKGGLGTLFSQSMVQGLQKLFSSFDSSGNGLMDNLENAGYNSVLQLIPFNALSRQIAEIKDPYARNTYEDSNIESKLINQAKKTIPILRETLPQKFKTTGEADKARTLGNILFNPANIGTSNLDKTKNEILRLYNESGEKIQFPKISAKTITPLKKGKTTFEKIQLDGRQRSEYQKALGEETMKLFNKTINKSNYNKLDDEDKAKKLQGAITDADKLVKKNLIKKLNLPLTKKK